MADPPTKAAAPGAEAACLLAGVVVPLAFHPFGTLGFEATKGSLVRLLALVLALGWLAERLGRWSWTEARVEWRPPPGPIRIVGVALLAFLASQVISTAASIMPLRSLWGSYDRLQGLVTLAALVVIGIAAAVAGRVPERRDALLRWWLLASIPVCLYGVAQQFRLDPVDWLNRPGGITSTVGSSTALGTYLAMVAPLTLVEVLAARPATRGRGSGRYGGTRTAIEPERVFWIGVLTLQVVALALTEVRGAAIGLVVGVGVAGAIAFWWSDRRRAAFAIVGSVAVLAVILASVALLPGSRPASDPAAQSPTSAIPDPAAWQRLLIWQASLATSLSGWRLLMGFGPESQSVALEPRFPAELAGLVPDQRFDRAHNLLLDQLLTSGVFGLVTAVLLLYLVIRYGLAATALGQSANSLRVAGLIGVVAANLASNLFAFDLISTSVLNWMAAGFLVAPALSRELPPTTTVRSGGRRGRGPVTGGTTTRARLRATAALAAVALGALTAPYLVGPLVADLGHTRALALRAAEAPASSLREEIVALEWQPHQDVYALALGETYQILARDTAPQDAAPPATFEELATSLPQGREALFAAARLSFERAVALSPLDAYSHLHLARLWAEWSQVAREPDVRSERLARAVSEYESAIALSPNRPTFHDEAGQALLRAGRPAEAIRRFEQAEALSGPASERVARIGDALALQGDGAGARERYLAALRLDDRAAAAHHGLATLARAQGDPAAGLEAAQRAARFDMRNWEYRRTLALIYRDLGMREEALVEARAARRFAPSWEWDELSQLVESVR